MKQNLYYYKLQQCRQRGDKLTSNVAQSLLMLRFRPMGWMAAMGKTPMFTMVVGCSLCCVVPTNL